MNEIFTQYLITFGWAVTGAISMAVSLGIALKVFDKLTPIDEWQEIRSGNKTVGMIMTAVIIGTAFVIGLTIMPA